MKHSIFLSLILHIVVIAGLQFWRMTPRSTVKTPTIYQIELISAPLVMEQKANLAETKPEMPAPIVIPKPKKEVVKSQSTEKKEPAKEQLKTSKATENVGTSQIKIDAKDFPFVYYLNLIRYRIQENWQPPFQAVEQKEKLSAIIGFRILRTGKIVDVKLENSSGRFLFDQATQRAVYSTAKLPPLPDEFIGEYLTVHLEFEGAW